MGAFKGVIPSPVLAEVYYKVRSVTSKSDAEKVVDNFSARLNNCSVCPVELLHSSTSGEYYIRVNFETESGRLIEKNREDPDRISTVDAMVLAVGRFITDSVVCTYDKNMKQIKDVKVLTAEEVLSLN